MSKAAWKLLQRRVVFEHPHKRLVNWQMRTHLGKSKEFVIHEGRDVIFVIPITPTGEVVLLRQHYVAAQKVLWTIPTGMRDDGYTPLQIAGKELLEEAGYRAQRFISLGTAVKGKYATGVLRYYLALGAQPAGPQTLEDAEDITVRVLPWPKFIRMVQHGDIAEAWAAIGAYRAIQYLKRK